MNYIRSDLAEHTLRRELTRSLTWKQEGESTCATIPSRRGPFAVIYALLVAIWVAAASLRYWRLFASPHGNGADFTLQFIAAGVYIVGFFYFIWWFASTFTGETVLTLNPTTMTIQRRVLGIELYTRSFQTNKIYRVAYVGPDRKAKIKSVAGLNSSRIKFHTDKKTHSFAIGILEAEARVLIEQMLKTLR